MEYSKDAQLAKLTFSRKDIEEMAAYEAIARALGVGSPNIAEVGEPVFSWNNDGSVEVVIPYNPKP